MAEMASPLNEITGSKYNPGSKDDQKIPNTIVKGPIYNKLATRVYRSK